MTPDQINALTAFLAGMAIAGGVVCWVLWCEKRKRGGRG